MELDDLKALSREQSTRLEASVHLNTALMHQTNLGSADTSLHRLARSLWVETTALLAILIALGSFAADHFTQTRLLIPTIALDAYVLALLIANVRQLVALNGLNFDEPVVAIQLRLSRLRLLRVSTIMWMLLFGPLMWVPLIIVTFAVFGGDLYRFAAPPYLGANILLGLAVIALARWLSRRYGDRVNSSRTIRFVADAFAGRHLRAALDVVDNIERFETA